MPAAARLDSPEAMPTGNGFPNTGLGLMLRIEQWEDDRIIAPIGLIYKIYRSRLAEGGRLRRADKIICNKAHSLIEYCAGFQLISLLWRKKE